MAINITTPPVNEPITVTEAKQQCKIESAITEDDTLIASYIKASRAECEQVQRRQLITATYRYTLDCFSSIIVLPRPPLQSVTSIQYIDTEGETQTFSADNYTVDAYSTPGRIVVKNNVSIPNTSTVPNAVTVIFVAGYGDDGTDVPEETRQAIRLNVGFLYHNRGDAKTERPPAIDCLMSKDKWGSYL